MKPIVFLMIAMFYFQNGWTQLTTLLRSGPAGSKYDLVIVGDGFTAANQNDFNQYIHDRILNELFNEGPLWENMNAFNIYRINLVSNDLGVTQIDDAGNVTTARNTALDYRYSGSWDRCWMEAGPNTWTTLNNVLNNQVPGWDFVFIILNESGFGGCAGGNNLAVTLSGSWTVAAHEMGHMVGKLADEYCADRNATATEPNAVNVTINRNRSTLKWNNFVNQKTPIPTGLVAGGGCCAGYTAGVKPADWSDSDDAGLFEGARYSCDSIFRPVINCRMRGNAPPFCPVCYNAIKERMDPLHEYIYSKSYAGDFTGDGKTDIVIHNDNSLALYRSEDSQLEPIWIETGEIPVWDDFMPHDQFFVGDFDGDNKDDLYVFNTEDWLYPYLGMLKSTGTGFQAVRLYGPTLPGWDDMKSHDQFFVADFNQDGKDDLYIFNGLDWSMGYLIMLKSNGTSLSLVKRYDQNLPGWGEMRKNDIFYVGDFNKDKSEDLFIFNGTDWSIAYLQMLKSNATSLTHVRRYDRELPGWDDMKKYDKFYIGDFNADGRSDIYVFNGKDWSMDYLQMLQSTGTSLSYVKRYDGSIPGWDGLASNDQFYIADVNGDHRSDLYVYNYSDWATEYLGMLRSNGTSLNGGWQSDWIGSWNMGRVDRLLVGNFNGGSGWDDLFIRNDNWFGLLQSYKTSLGMTAIYPKWIHRHNYHILGWW